MTSIACWLILLGAVTAWAILSSLVDRHWLGTLVAFAPRWLLLAPVAALLPLAAFYSRGAVAVLALAGVVVLGPVMDLSVPWRRFGPEWRSAGQVRVLSCNVGGRADFESLGRLAQQQRVAVVACQEWPGGVAWPGEPDEWHVAQDGSLLIASRYPLSGVAVLISPTEAWRRLALACDLQTEAGTLRCASIHLLTPREGLEAFLRRDPDAPARLTAVNQARSNDSLLVRQWIEQQGVSVVLGDFNMVEESRLYARDWGAWDNAFSHSGWGYGPTRFTRKLSVRIDHVVSRPPGTSTRCWVGPDVGSDHRPVIADLRLVSTSAH